MPNTGTPAPSTPRIASTAYPAAAGSPGPLLKTTPSGEAARMSAALLVAGSTRTSHPRAARLRGVDALMPRSTAATRNLACPCGRTADGDPGHPLGPQVGIQVAGGPPARRQPGRLAHHVAAHPGPAGLRVFLVDARVAEIRRGHRHNLP